MEEVTVKVKDEKPKGVITEEDVQQKLMLYQLLEKQAESLREQLMMMEQRMLEINSTKEAIKNLKAGDTDVMIPIGSGVYKQGKLEGVKFLVDLGSGVMVNRDKTSVNGYIEKFIKDAEKGHDEIEKQLLTVIEKINEIALDVQKMSKDIQK